MAYISVGVTIFGGRVYYSGAPVVCSLLTPPSPRLKGLPGLLTCFPSPGTFAHFLLALDRHTLSDPVLPTFIAVSILLVGKVSEPFGYESAKHQPDLCVPLEL